MNDYGRWLAEAIDRIWIRVLLWVCVIGIMCGQWYHARCVSFVDESRGDGHSGHVQIDFGGQWLFGRSLLTGHGKELYHRSVYWSITYECFPRDRESPTQKGHDDEGLVNCFMGDDPPRISSTVCAAMLPIFSDSPLSAILNLSITNDQFSTKPLTEFEYPIDIGGPLYPPIHAFIMAPLAALEPKQAMHVWQICLSLFALIAGLGVSYLSRRKIWWCAAVLIILGFPAYRSAIDLGQNSSLTLMIAIWGWALNVRGRPILGGIVWGMLAYKPVWGLTFFIAAMALRQWRFGLSMCITGLMLVIFTLPFVGVQSWKDWLHVGGLASKIYDVDHNWVFLSRDLFGLPRRMILDYDIVREKRETNFAKIAAWVVWFIAVELCIRIWMLRRKRHELPLVGSFPAFLFLGSFLCCYHFMYYDSLMASFGIFVLLAESPHRFFNPAMGRLEVERSTTKSSGVVLVNSVVLTLLAVLIIHENMIQGLNVQATMAVGYLAHDLQLPNGETKHVVPTMYLESGVRYPWDTIVIIVIWVWCAGLAYRDDDRE